MIALLAFLKDRLKEEEADALESKNAPDGVLRFLDADRWTEALSWQADADLVLRRVEADRKLLDLYERAKSYRDEVFAQPEPRSISDEMRAVTQMMALEQVLKLRVAVWSDHPDYQPEWKPAA